jgi:hypothetical protein
MRLAFALAAAMVAGCGHSPRVSLAPPPGEIKAKQYVEMLKRWTRHGHSISDFDEALTVDATMHSPEFRAAYAEKWIDVYKLAPDEAARTRVDLNGQIANVWEFHFNTSGHTWEVNEMLPSKKQWVLQLLDDKGRAVEASFVKQVRDRIEVEQAFYPQAGIFTRAWTVQFPRNLPDGTPLVNTDTRSITLRIAGPKGDIDLIWKLQ